MKRCSKCKIEKEATTEFFGIDKRKKDGLQCQCRQCQNSYTILRRNTLEFREKRRVYDIERNSDPEFQKRKSAYDAKRMLDPEIYNRKNICDSNRRLSHEYKEKRRIYQSEYLKTEHGKFISSMNKQKRRTLKLSLPNTFTVEEWQQCLSYWDNKCAYCGSSNNLQMDHFIPLISKDEPCPGTIKENIVPACQTCNFSKHNKSPYEWASKNVLDRIGIYFDTPPC